MAEDGVVCALDDAWEDGEAGPEAVSGFVGVTRGGVVDVFVCALGPGVVCGGVDGFFHGGAVEVYGCVGRRVGEGTGEAEHVPEERAGGGYLVDVPALRGRVVSRLVFFGGRGETAYGVHGHGGVYDVVVEGAVFSCSDAFQGWEGTGWWVD